MSFAVLVRDVLAETLNWSAKEKDPALLDRLTELVQEILLETLKDDAVRRETYENAIEVVDDLDMMKVHAVLDGLVMVVGESNA